MAVHVLVELGRVGIQVFDAVVDDPAVGLMADHPVQIVQRQSCLSQNLVQALGQGIHRKAENSLAVHGNGRRTSPIRPACVDGIIAPGSQRDGERSIGQCVNGRARAISKEDTGRAVGWVHQTGKGLAPYHQRILPAQCGEQAAGHGGAVDKTGAGRVDVQCRAVFGQAQCTLHLTGHARGRVRGREGSTDTTGDLLRGQAAAFQRLPGGGGICIDETEALIAIDVNSGRATKEKDLEETALKTNLEACDEIARQLRMRNLAGLVVIDFIDMDEPANNHAVEKRMKEALKKDRSRIQVGKMSMFGLLELSRQRMHSSFFESNYQVCPHCQGKGMVRTIESGAVYVLRGIEEEGIKNRSSRLNVYVPSETAIYLLNQKRQMLLGLEQKYKMTVIISADDSIKCISDYRIERTKNVKPAEEEKNEPEIQQETAVEENANDNETRNEENEEASGEELSLIHI